MVLHKHTPALKVDRVEWTFSLGLKLIALLLSALKGVCKEY